jgi:hypothetical protein
MLIKKGLAALVVLALGALACRQLSVLGFGSTPTAEVLPTSTEAAPPTATRSIEAATAVPAAQPTIESEHTPVISSVELRPEASGSDMIVYQDISFSDAKGDVNFANYKLVSATTENLSIQDGSVDIPAEEQRNGAKLTATWNCGSNSYEATLSVSLSDKAGNKSEPYEYTIVCGAGKVEAGFPDQFDDNRNGWGLGDAVSIKDGLLQFRNIPEDKIYRVWCDACRVTPEQNAVSVESTWENSPVASLGLMIDDDTCTPNYLVFLISTNGYYSIQQSVRDEAGNWSHWRPYIDWTKSSLIRRSQNIKNTITTTYAFGDELTVTFFLNGTSVTRVRVYGYNGSKECRPGLVADGGLKADFDNFSISNSSP